MKVLVADPLAKEGIEILSEVAQVDVKTGLKAEEIISIIGDYESIIVRSQTRVTADIIKAGKKLVVIGRAGVGVDNIDVDQATQCGIIVVNAPTGNTISAAEHAIALMLALARHIPAANASLKSGQWRRADFMGTEVKGKTLGIIGLGNVGSYVARCARGMDMKIIAYDPFISPERAKNLQAEIVSLEQIMKDSDFISLHIPLTESTKGLISEKMLAMVKPSVRIINTARGGLIDEEALVKAIEEKRVAGAAIDVFAKEPCTESILFQNEKIIVTPHLGASTTEAQALAATEVARQIVDVFRGQPARYAVNAPFISSEAMPVIGPFIRTGNIIGSLASQLAEGQMQEIRIKYSGEITNYDTNTVKAAILGGILKGITEERVNLVNANVVASKRGLTVTEQKEAACENYTNLVTIEAITSAGSTTVSGTVLRGEPHIVQIDSYWLDIVPTGGYFLFSDHHDRPGIIGAVGKITGDADINISYMNLSRLKPRGQALMILALDEALPEKQRQQILSLPDIRTAKLVKL